MGVLVRDNYLYTLSFSDDQGVVAQVEKGLKFMLRKLKEEYGKSGVEIDLGKTKYLTTPEATKYLEFDGGSVVEEASAFKNPGFIFS